MVYYIWSFVSHLYHLDYRGSVLVDKLFRTPAIGDGTQTCIHLLFLPPVHPLWNRLKSLGNSFKVKLVVIAFCLRKEGGPY